ncbi:hypothetical protein ES332_A13G150900v1 [Gossypium tomentosum]|uniref:Uncharacterized protein n=1 Tax=Gossypium tomentosum TaxID=34277 RepID=A0A5D2ML84_GOSTO|nr:hypothetical protein ES332_A13G150900v1 [Gossypium tomentosum]
MRFNFINRDTPPPVRIKRSRDRSLLRVRHNPYVIATFVPHISYINRLPRWKRQHTELPRLRKIKRHGGREQHQSR